MKTQYRLLVPAILIFSVAGAVSAGEHTGMKDHLMMKDGKVMMVMGEKSTATDKDVMLTNGTKVSSDGSVTMKDGAKMTKKEGEMMSMDGEMMKHVAK